MLKGTDVIGLPVITFDTGEKVEKVTDVVFDHEQRRVLGLVVDDGGWFREARVVPFEAARTIGPDAVIIATKDAVATAGQQDEIRKILERDNILKGTRIVTTDGRELGTLRDLYFDEQTGDVEGFEVSGGLFADAYEGRSFVPASTTITIGEAVAFVTPETVDLMEEQVGGIRGAVESAGESIRSGAATAGERIGEGWDKTREGARNLGERLEQGGPAKQTPPATLEESWGRRVKREVRDPEGYLVAAPGQIVTDPVIARARQAGREQELLAAVTTFDDSGAAGMGARGQALEQRVREGAASVKEEAKGLWERIKERASAAKERASQDNESRRINVALGRPVSRVILDRNDGVILNVGEIITHRAVALSRTEGVLDILLDSVAVEEVALGPEYLRAPERGQAALEGSQVPVQDRSPESPLERGSGEPPAPER